MRRKLQKPLNFKIDFSQLDHYDSQIVRDAIDQLKEERSEPDATDEECVIEIINSWLRESVWTT